MKTIIALIAVTILAGCSSFAKVDAYAIPDYQIEETTVAEEVFIGMYYKNASKRYDGKYKPFRAAPKSEYERISTANAGRVLISMMRDNTKVVSKKSKEDAVLNVYVNYPATKDHWASTAFRPLLFSHVPQQTLR